MDLFAEFLEIQMQVIDQMEERLLSLETNPDKAVSQELKRIIHTQKGEAGFLNLSDVEKICHLTEDLLENDMAYKNMDILFSVIDWLRKTNAWYRGDVQIEPEPVGSLFNSLKNIVFETAPKETAFEHDHGQRAEKALKTPALSENKLRQTIRVDSERLDRLIDMIGELVIAESMVVQSKEIRSVQSQELLKNIGQMDKITRTLHEAGLMLRMVPMKEIFQKMIRLVRDTSKKSGKNVLCHIQGEETELDKTLVDKIGEPLLHIIRNAVDHGIEDSESTRTTTGKSPQGNIYIRAFHKSGYVHIEIEDDGKGLDKNSILNKAKENGLITIDTPVSEQDIFSLIFEPGFSTAEKVTDLSGRGQGMNVVKDVVDSLHGQVDVSSIEGKGTVFIIKIPLTLAIIDGMIIRAGKERYVIPTLSIVTSCRLDEKNVTSLISKEKTILIHGRLIPLVDLCEWFNIEKPDSDFPSKLLIVVESGNRRIALSVDEIIGKQQIVIKNLPESFTHNPGISGAAIMPDGTVGLIVDVDRLTHI
jgi:two-component system chemotaxis sensor kinase CheA